MGRGWMWCWLAPPFDEKVVGGLVVWEHVWEQQSQEKQPATIR